MKDEEEQLEKLKQGLSDSQRMKIGQAVKDGEIDKDWTIYNVLFGSPVFDKAMKLKKDSGQWFELNFIGLTSLERKWLNDSDAAVTDAVFLSKRTNQSKFFQLLSKEADKK